MPLTLYVDHEAWHQHLKAKVAEDPGLVPVAKGNGYGFTVPLLALLTLVNAAPVSVAAARPPLAMASSGGSPHRSVSVNSASALTTIASSCFSAVIAAGASDTGPSSNGASA